MNFFGDSIMRIAPRMYMTPMYLLTLLTAISTQKLVAQDSFPPIMPDADQIFEVEDGQSKAFAFSPDAYRLSDKDESELRAFLKSNKDSEKKVIRAVIASWADKAYPTDGKLSKKEKRLAKKRSASIRKIIEDEGIKRIQLYNMAAGPNWLQKLFDTDKAEIDRAMKGGIPARRMAKIAQALQNEGGSSKAIVFLVVKEQLPKTAH